MTTVQIEKSVPLPNTKYGNGNPKYPWEAMEIGDSFLISEVPGDTQNQSANRAQNAMAFGRSKTGHRYTSRAVEGGRRIWRVE